MRHKVTTIAPGFVAGVWPEELPMVVRQRAISNHVRRRAGATFRPRGQAGFRFPNAVPRNPEGRSITSARRLPMPRRHLHGRDANEKIGPNAGRSPLLRERMLP